MANPEHVAVVRKGKDAIAEWRRSNPGVRLDLREANLVDAADLVGADLREADLSGAKIGRANLSGANLSEADLTQAVLLGAWLHRANLTRAKLAGADLGSAFLVGALLDRSELTGADLLSANLFNARLSRANLSEANLALSCLLGADLSGSNLRGANLTGADFSSAKLSRANLRGADLSMAKMFVTELSDTDLSQATFGYSSVGDVDLSGVVGLATVNHEAPSSVGVDTLITSFRGAGNNLTPELATFFRGAGVPEELLRELPRLVAEVKYYSCFVCYGQPDVTFAKKLCQDLEARGVSCWLYDMDATVGEPTWGEIGRMRRQADKMVVLCSGQALVRPGMLKEIEEQIDEGLDKLVPISLDDFWKHPGLKVMRDGRDLKPFLLDRNYADFTNLPYQQALERLLAGLGRQDT